MQTQVSTSRIAKFVVCCSLAFVGCGETRYSTDDLQPGVAVTIDGNVEAIDSATVFLPDDLPGYISIHPQLEDEGIAVLNLEDGRFDAVVVYRTGPYCGLLPTVSVDGDATALTIDVESRQSGDCDALQYDEAIGLDLAPQYEQATIDANHNG